MLKKTADDKYLSQVREQQKDIPICTLDDLSAADGVLIGSPTRYGNMTAQMKQLIDSTATLWLKGEMEGKPAGVFTSTASTHGDQETTLVTPLLGHWAAELPKSQQESVANQLSQQVNWQAIERGSHVNNVGVAFSFSWARLHGLPGRVVDWRGRIE